MLQQPELLAPAGSLETLKYAVMYGADAVYCALPEFGMRAAPVNLTVGELHEGCIFAHARGKKVYLTLNTLPTNEELSKLPRYIQDAAEAGVDAFIIADLGVLALAKKYAPQVERHVSTQAGITNYEAAKVCYELGAKRVVLARELPLTEIAQIRDNCPQDLELEAFVHGAMCMSVSGRCLLSSYMAGRSGNRGECAQPCRWKYSLVEEHRPGQYMEIGESEDNGSYILNANDLCTAPFIDLICKAGVDSLKIEGRAKTFYYVASVVSAYRRALDAFLADPYNDSFELPAEPHEPPPLLAGILLRQGAGPADSQPHLCARLGFHRHGGQLGERRCPLHPARQVRGGGQHRNFAARRQRRQADACVDRERRRRARGRHPAPDDAVHHPLRDAADGVQPDSDAEAVIVLLPGTMLASTRGQMRASAPTKQLQK